MIENFPNERRMHCETGVLVNMMEYYGFTISEPMAFGIGSGLYFMYFPWMKVQDFILVVMRTRPKEIIRRFAKRLNLGFHEKSFGNDADKATKALDELVAKNIPVGLVSNLFGLKYLTNIGFELDYNGHHYVVVGKEGTQYVIADTNETLPNDDYVYLEETYLRYSRFRPGISAPHGWMFHIDPLPKDFSQKTDLRPAVFEGIMETCKNMLSLKLGFFGAKGIHYLANDIRKWPKKYTQQKINNQLLWDYRILERAGTGGSGYRYIYSDFLKEAAVLFQSEVLHECGNMYSKAADCWRQFTVGCNRYISRKGVTLNELADFIDEAAEYEKQTFLIIKNQFLKNIKEP